MTTSINLEKLKKEKPAPEKKSSGCMVYMSAFVFVLVLAGALSGYYLFNYGYVQVESYQQVVVKRLGKFNRTLGPGLHFVIPLGIETITPITVRTSIEEFGFRTVKAGIKSEFDKNFAQESLILTGDLNLADVTWVVQYKIINAENFLFHVKNTKKMIRDVSLAAMESVIGDRRVSDVITTARIEIALKVKQIMQQAFDKFKIGVKIDVVNIREANPPPLVKPSFNEVNEAKQEVEKVINQAWEYYISEVPKAEGEAKKMIAEANGYYFQVVGQAKGETSGFLALLTEYLRAPKITKQRLYYEAMEEILPQVKGLYITPSNDKSVLSILNLPPFDNSNKPILPKVSK